MAKLVQIIRYSYLSDRWDISHRSYCFLFWQRLFFKGCIKSPFWQYVTTTWCDKKGIYV